MAAWWGTYNDLSYRMKEEAAAMHAAFPIGVVKPVKNNSSWDISKFFLKASQCKLVAENRAPAYWIVSFKMHPYYRGEQIEYTIKVVYPREYPNEQPLVYILSPRGVVSKHMYSDNNLCLNHSNNPRYGWDSGLSTAATSAMWAVQWIRTWEKFGSSGWPDLV